MVAIGECHAALVDTDGSGRKYWQYDFVDESASPDDPRWPSACACGYAFTSEDARQVFIRTLYRRAGTGDVMLLEDAPDGAMWDADWLRGFYAPTPDDRYIMVRCPGGHDWCIDSRASNCTMKDDKVHHCWVRHGEPPNLTVDKNGFTCQAGAGSIIAGDFHGFLRDGCFT